MIELSEIKFSELHKIIDDVPCVVMMGVYPILKEDIPTICEFFSSASGICDTKRENCVTSIRKITGNINSENSRVDWLVTFDDDTTFNVISRLKYGSFIKWPEDFIDNYNDDYCYSGYE